MLERQVQHRALVGVSKLQRLALDLASQLVARHIPAERRKAAAVFIEFGEDLAELRAPGSIIGRHPRQGEKPAMIAPVQLGHLIAAPPRRPASASRARIPNPPVSHASLMYETLSVNRRE